MTEQHAIIGRFINSNNSFEFQINIILEIIFDFIRKENEGSLKIDLIDYFHEASLNKRMELLVFSLLTLNIGERKFDSEILLLIEIKNSFTKKFQTTRDLVAHNPLIPIAGDYLITSSRRYKGKSNSIGIDELEKLSDDLAMINQSCNELASMIQGKLKIEPVRDLPNK